MAAGNSKCQNPSNCPCTNVRTRYVHLAKGHTFYKQPSVGPTPSSAPHPQPCPNDIVYDPLTTYPPVDTYCPQCGYNKVW